MRFRLSAAERTVLRLMVACIDYSGSQLIATSRGRLQAGSAYPALRSLERAGLLRFGEHRRYRLTREGAGFARNIRGT